MTPALLVSAQTLSSTNYLFGIDAMDCRGAAALAAEPISKLSFELVQSSASAQTVRIARFLLLRSNRPSDRRPNAVAACDRNPETLALNNASPSKRI
jgi:hypothetical protein